MAPPPMAPPPMAPPPPAITVVWVDCDPGHDDAVALLLAGHSPAVDLVGVSTVHGNTSGDNTFANARACLAYLCLAHVPVHKGQAKPLCRAPHPYCPEIHGQSGLDSLDGSPLFPPAPAPAPPPPPPSSSTEARCVRAMREAVAAANGAGRKLTLVATGALTNVALLLLLHPELAAESRRDDFEVVLMGGCYGLGNTGPVAEFNIQIDPEAAKVVFESGARVTMVPLEVTHTALATERVLARIAGNSPDPSALRAKLCDLLCFFKESYRSYFGFEDPPLHDPCAVAYVIAPSLFEAERIRVDIETGSALCAGQTVCDRHNLKGKPTNATVCFRMDVDGFWDLICDAVDACDEARQQQQQQQQQAT